MSDRLDRLGPRPNGWRRAVLPLAWLLTAVLAPLAIVARVWPAPFSGPVLDVTTTLLPSPVAFTLGLLARRWSGLAGVVAVAVCFEINQGYVNPFILVLTFGPWYAGTMIRSRQVAARQLAELSQQLEIENDRLAEQTVRLERARIAHELHDIVAHSVSVMVVQAYAGAQLTRTGQPGADEALGHIRAAAAQAHDEIGRLVELLATPTAPEPVAPLPVGLAELVTTAAATGIPVTLRALAGLDELPAPINATAYRIVQEAITNALKHAPGAPIDIAIGRRAGRVHLVITNSSASVSARTDLHTAGGGHGISGMRSRVEELGGRLRAGPDDQGWRVSAELPLLGEPDRPRVVDA